MNASYEWLRDFVSFAVTPEELRDLLTSRVVTVDDLVRHTAKRSVFSADELAAMTPRPSSPVKVIDFLLIGHLQPAVPLSDLLAQGVFNNRPPQSIAELLAWAGIDAEHIADAARQLATSR